MASAFDVVAGCWHQNPRIVGAADAVRPAATSEVAAPNVNAEDKMALTLGQFIPMGYPFNRS
jgi:hypothetical protein